MFLEIHPFQDGNGRLSRILTTLLLLRAGYAYVPCSSLESVIEHSKEGYGAPGHARQVAARLVCIGVRQVWTIKNRIQNIGFYRKRQGKYTIDKRLGCTLRAASISPTVKNPLDSFSGV